MSAARKFLVFEVERLPGLEAVQLVPRGVVSDAGRLPKLPSKPPTKRQRIVLYLVAKGLRERGLPPSFREIGASMSIRSTYAVAFHLDALERKGLVRREHARSRAIQITAAGWAALQEPVEANNAG